MKRLAISIARHLAHLLLLPLEIILGLIAPEDARPQIFIIGSPRSGTSLLYEMMVTGYRFAFISNLSHRFYLTPLAAALLGRRQIAAWQGNFESRYGHIKGWGAPNEGGWVWRRWLQDGDWTDGAGFPAGDIKALRKLTSGLSHLFGAPFINKNVMHSNRLRLMHRIWPDAIFIHVRRDPADNVRSIIRAERGEGGPAHDGDLWWSVRPSIASEYMGRSDIARAAAQVWGVESDIARDIKMLDSDRLITIDYTDICNAPQRTLQRITGFATDKGISLQENRSVPAIFNSQPSVALGDDDEAKIKASLLALQADLLK